MTTNDPFAALQAALANAPTSPSSGSGTPGQPGISNSEQNYYSVYFGSSLANPTRIDGGHTEYDRPKTPVMRQDSIKTLDQAMAMFYDPEQYTAIMAKLYKLGLISSPNDVANAESVWSNAVQMAGRFYTNSGQKNKITPWAILDMFAGGKAAEAAPKPYTHTSTNRSVQSFTTADLKGYANEAYQKFLGRDASAKERAAMASALKKYAASNPSVSKTVVHGDGQGNESSSTTSSGGVSAAGLNQTMQDTAQTDPEYGAYQASTTYMNVLQSLLGSAV